jgi:DNA-binding NarL/FixJ family response regulator
LQLIIKKEKNIVSTLINVLYAINAELIARAIQSIWKDEANEITSHYIACTNPVSILQELSTQMYQVVVIDFDYFGGGIDEFVKQLKALHPELKIVVVSEKFDRSILQLYKSGVCASFSKNDKVSTIRQVFQAIASNQLYLPNAVIMNIISGKVYSFSMEDQLRLLSNKEMAVLEQLAAGKRMKEIAVLLHIAPSTLSTHKTRIMQKLGVETKKDLYNFLDTYNDWKKNSPA